MARVLDQALHMIDLAGAGFGVIAGIGAEPGRGQTSEGDFAIGVLTDEGFKRVGRRGVFLRNMPDVGDDVAGTAPASRR